MYNSEFEERESGRRSVMVTNTTVEIVVPENVIGSIYGENGSNLARLRQISGAKVIVHEPHPGATDRKEHFVELSAGKTEADVVVIGSGIAGLCCAGLLSRYQQDVVVL
ncbi:hypothetical protein HYC85_009883 [Camellia sinensis]|uniref:K Homology domain-containing protein n=1 Tax=Camellia sinensis TaxID=4442 RepID=A0A7J7HGV5_CAMSI|nr:hypothetical protein HYC85_009883 [Camellia sinensis]